MPHKEAIMKSLSRIDPAAGRIGAVNTVVPDGNGWAGYNTDYSGALKALEPHGPLKDKNVLIIGAGGTAKAIGQGVVDQGAILTLTYNRNKEKAQTLADQLKCKLISIRDVDQAAVDILINCSPVGMAPNTNDTPFPARLLKPGMVVFDSVYNPMETRLLKDAEAAGCATVSGVELFVHQAAGQIELWTGKTAPIGLMRQVVEEKLSSRE
jgi:shikimate dehydrogenase